MRLVQISFPCPSRRHHPCPLIRARRDYARLRPQERLLLQPEADDADPEGAALLAELTFEALKEDRLDYVGGLEMGAVPLAGALAQLSWLKSRPIAAFFVRKKPKEHGAQLAVEGLAKGETLQGKRIVIVEDVTTTGGSAIKALDAVREAGGEVVLVYTMVDREEGATETFAQAGVTFRALYRASEFLKA